MANANFRKNYRRTLELCVLIVLVVVQLTFFGFRFLSFETKIVEAMPKAPKVIKMAKTEQFHKPKEPKRPTTLAEVEDSELPEDEELDLEFGFDFTTPPPAPKLQRDEIVPFFAVDQKPEPDGGYSQIGKYLVYPELARKLQIEGQTVVEIVISKTGKVISAVVYKSSGNQLLDKAAVAALLKIKWHPAYQRDLPVNVRVSVPIDFRLR